MIQPGGFAHFAAKPPNLINRLSRRRKQPAGMTRSRIHRQSKIDNHIFMHKNIKTVAGCLTRVTCEITAPEGTDTTLSAYLVYEGESRPATLESAGVIIFPAVPYGHYAYEIRCGGKPVAFGHLLVRPSAFPHTDGMVDYTLAADLTTTDAAMLELTLTPGPRGPQGEAGPPCELDDTPTSGSTNAVSSGGLYDILYGSAVTLGQDADNSSVLDVVIGREAYTTASGGVAIGYLAVAAQNSVAVGYNARSSMAGWGVSLGAGATVGGTNFSVAIGSNASTTKSSSQVIGNSTALKNEGVTLIGTWDSINRTVQTLFYIIAAGSELAVKYEGGEACLGYVIKESSGNVLACGTRKLSELLTNSTAFAPAAMDLDADPPTPFLPEGIMEPVEFEN